MKEIKLKTRHLKNIEKLSRNDEQENDTIIIQNDQEFENENGANYENETIESNEGVTGEENKTKLGITVKKPVKLMDYKLYTAYGLLNE